MAITCVVPTIALVFSAGGPTATAFHGGALAGLAEVTGWDPRTAHVVVGTSAGSNSAAILRAGFSAADEYARLTDGPLSAQGQRLFDEVTAVGDAVDAANANARNSANARNGPGAHPVTGGNGHVHDAHRHADPHHVSLKGLDAVRPYSLRMALAGLSPRRLRPGLVLAGLVPRGTRSLQRMGATAGAAHENWPDAATWIVAVRAKDGARAVFGRDDLPATDIGTAVRASSAVPNLYEPVRIGRHDFVDGAVHSSTNADLVAPLGLDAVVIISSMTAIPAHSHCTDRAPMRAHFSRLLAREVAAIRRGDTPVIVIQPTRADLDARRGEPSDATIKAVTEQARNTALTKLTRNEAHAGRAALEAAGIEGASSEAAARQTAANESE